MASVKPQPETEFLRRDSAHGIGLDQWRNDKDSRLDDHSLLALASCSNAGHEPYADHKPPARRKDESLSAYIRAGIINHQLGLSINCILLLTLSHIFFPALRPTTTPFFFFSYHDESTNLYHPGPNDLKLVASWIVIFTGLRAAVMDNLLIPLARRAGVTKPKASIRFAEQAWLFLYYVTFWIIGMSLWIQSDHFFNLPATFDGFPTVAISGLMKWYYLAQFAFWLQQIVVVHIEERRKDHWQMFTHHIITCMLIATSYGHYLTRIGTVMLCIMDVVDFIFPAAKLLKYAGYQTACDIAFGVFIVTWFLARHVYYLAFCWSAYADASQRMATGCYDSKTGRQISSRTDDRVFANLFHAYGDRSQPVCFDKRMQAIYITLLLALQLLTIVWFRMICRVAYGVLAGRGAQDSRSDDEDEDGDEDEEEADGDEDEADRSRREHVEKTGSRSPKPAGTETGTRTGTGTGAGTGDGAPRSNGDCNSKGGRRNHSNRKTPVSTTPPKVYAAQSRTSAVALPGHAGDDKQLQL